MGLSRLGEKTDVAAAATAFSFFGRTKDGPRKEGGNLRVPLTSERFKKRKERRREGEWAEIKEFLSVVSNQLISNMVAV